MDVLIGGQLIIEPGYTKDDISQLLNLQKEKGLLVTRIRMFESYMKSECDVWDFTLFDHAFQTASILGIKIFATLFPYTQFEDIGGFKFPRDQKHFAQILDYIDTMVNHFSQFDSCYGWVLINEPGQGFLPETPFCQSRYDQYRKDHANDSDFEKTGMDFSKKKFMWEYTGTYLRILADRVRSLAPQAHIHVNPHALFSANLGEYDFPSWRSFLDSVGGSAHASWHFGLFTREQYTLAMTATAEIVRGGAGDKPWFMTEIQGGNNFFSGKSPLCPTKEEIVQWLWAVIGTGGKGGIFWSLNYRSKGHEAGEWGLVDFQNRSTDRLEGASSVARIINSHRALFNSARPVETGITLLYIKESLWTEQRMNRAGDSHWRGLSGESVVESTLAMFEALTQMGLSCGITEIGSYDFHRQDYSENTVILSHQISLPSCYWDKLRHFVSCGGTLIAEGLTAYYDEENNCLPLGKFPLSDLFGGYLQEVKLHSPAFDMELLQKKGQTINSHLWYGCLKPESGQEAARFLGNTTALYNPFGKGSVLWIPSLVSLGGRLNGYEGLIHLLEAHLDYKKGPLQWKGLFPGLISRYLMSGQTLISLFINKDKSKRAVELETMNVKSPRILFSDKEGNLSPDRILEICPEETIVICWESGQDDPQEF